MKIFKVKVLEIAMGDVEDPEIYAAEPLIKWENSEVGQWVMAKSFEKPVFNIIPDAITYGWKVVVSAHLSEQDYTFWKLKYE